MVADVTLAAPLQGRMEIAGSERLRLTHLVQRIWT